MDIEEFILEHEKEDKNSLNYLIPELLLRRCKKLAKAEGRAEGEAIGAAAGQRRTLNILLDAKFGQVSEDLQATLRRADSQQMERLAIAVLTADSVEDALNAAGLRI